MDIINVPLGWILRIIYQLVQNYGLAIILFTLITKFILLPLSLKQQKSMTQTMLIQPKLNALQKQYGNNKEKFSEESMKLYKKYGVNPMSGCLPLLIQFPIIIALYTVIREPLTYIFSIKDAAVIDTMAKAIESAKIAGVSLGDAATREISITSIFSQYASNFKEYAEYAINYNFLGLNLATKPEFTKPDVIWVIPALAGITTWLSSKITQLTTKKKDEEQTNKRPPKPGEKDPSATSNTMLKVMPFMTIWFAFLMPAGVGLYWVASNIFQMGQQFILNKFYVPKIRERMAIENEELDSTRKGRKNSGRGNKSRSK